MLDAPPLAEDIAADPLLRGRKLIAWAGDDQLLPRGGERGFPHWGRWAERNRRFASDAAACLGRAEPATASALATRWARALIPRVWWFRVFVRVCTAAAACLGRAEPATASALATR